MNSRKFLWLVTVGVATWVVAASTGQLIVFATGVPASSSLLNGFIVPFLLVLGVLPTRSKFPVTIAFTVYGILATFTVLLGPPGIQKIPVAIVAGLITDLLIILFKKLKMNKALSYCIAFGVWGLLLAALAWIVYQIMELPGKDRFEQMFFVMVVAFVVEAAIAGVVAVKIYDKSNFAKNPLIIRLNGDSTQE